MSAIGECDCDGNTVPGALMNWAPGGDASMPWVERCDDCKRYADDDAAARAVASAIGGRICWAALDDIRPSTREHACPFVLTRSQLAALAPDGDALERVSDAAERALRDLFPVDKLTGEQWQGLRLAAGHVAQAAMIAAADVRQ